MEFRAKILSILTLLSCPENAKPDKRIQTIITEFLFK